MARFDAKGWTCRDAIRPWVRTNEDVAWQLRQSLFLAVAPSVEQAYTSFPRLAAVRPEVPVEYLVRPAGDGVKAGNFVSGFLVALAGSHMARGAQPFGDPLDVEEVDVARCT